MALTESKVKNLKPEARPFKVSDERGLYLEVTPAGGKLWRFRYRFGGQEKKLSIGCYPEVSLKEARQAAYEARHSIANGDDPAVEKQKKKVRVSMLQANTIGEIARA